MHSLFRIAAGGLFARHHRIPAVRFATEGGQAFGHQRRRCPIGLLTAGSGPGCCWYMVAWARINSWQPVWGPLTGYRRVTAMDRSGRSAALTSEQGGPVDVAGHSIGATCVPGAAAGGASFRRILLYAPPAPQATQNDWPERIRRACWALGPRLVRNPVIPREPKTAGVLVVQSAPPRTERLGR